MVYLGEDTEGNKVIIRQGVVDNSVVSFANGDVVQRRIGIMRDVWGKGVRIHKVGGQGQGDNAFTIDSEATVLRWFLYLSSGHGCIDAVCDVSAILLSIVMLALGRLVGGAPAGELLVLTPQSVG